MFQRATVAKLAVFGTAIVALISVVSHLVGVVPPEGVVQPPGVEWFTLQRQAYLENPFIRYAHVFSAAIFSLIAPFQFSEKFRNRHLVLHRKLGRTFLAITPIVAASGLALGVTMPFGGFLETLYSLLTFSLVLWAAWNALSLIRARNIQGHREWMIRLFAWTMSIVTMRIISGMFFFVQPFTERTWFSVSLFIGLAVNAVLAEVWIRHDT